MQKPWLLQNQLYQWCQIRCNSSRVYGVTLKCEYIDPSDQDFSGELYIYFIADAWVDFFTFVGWRLANCCFLQ